MNLELFINEIEKQKLNVEGIIVSQRGKITASHRWAPEESKNVFSVSKSFTSIAAGMVFDEGKLKLNDKVLDFFPQKAPSAKLASLTIGHLLTMTRGHAEFSRPQTAEEALSQELAFEPGRKFIYDNGTTFLLSAVLTKITGLSVRDFLVERLFRPLGIPDPVWTENEEGYTVGATGLQLRTSDMERFGQFLLCRGNWEGRKLVSTEWIEGATRTQVETSGNQKKSDWDIGYGWQFWTCRHGAYRCDGKDGQYIVVIPALDAVITVSSNEQNMEPILWTLWDTVLPLFDA